MDAKLISFREHPFALDLIKEVACSHISKDFGGSGRSVFEFEKESIAFLSSEQSLEDMRNHNQFIHELAKEEEKRSDISLEDYCSALKARMRLRNDSRTLGLFPSGGRFFSSLTISEMIQSAEKSVLVFQKQLDYIGWREILRQCGDQLFEKVKEGLELKILVSASPLVYPVFNLTETLFVNDMMRVSLESVSKPNFVLVDDDMFILETEKNDKSALCAFGGNEKISKRLRKEFDAYWLYSSKY